jgi:hypothetical protein
MEQWAVDARMGTINCPGMEQRTSDFLVAI